jgi:hypothetical protein
VSVEASEMVIIPRAELDALKAELTRLRREVGRGVAWGRNHDDAGSGDDRPRCTREALVRAWGISMCCWFASGGSGQGVGDQYVMLVRIRR